MRRARGWMILSAAALAVLSGSAWAEPTESPEEGRPCLSFLWPAGAVPRILDDLARVAEADPPSEALGTPSFLQPGEEGYKSPGRAFFVSLLVPGLGEIYSGSVRGLAFLGLEALSWGGYVYYDRKGKDERTKYEDYADQYYDPARYRDVVNEICGKYENWPDEPGWPSSVAEYKHCHEDQGMGTGYSQNKCNILRGHFILPEDKGQHYYEDLGKYDKYIFGWDDWYAAYEPARIPISWAEWEPGVKWPTMVEPFDETIGMKSAHREEYREMRRKSNDYLDRATYFTWFVVVNHVASALDAAFAARNHNRRLAGQPEGAGIGMDLQPLGDGQETRVYFRKNF